MGYVSVHHNVVFFDDCDPTYLVVVVAVLLVLHLALGLVVGLGLNDVASEHLRILNLDLRVVEDVVIVVDVFYYLDRLLAAALLFRL